MRIDYEQRFREEFPHVAVSNRTYRGTIPCHDREYVGTWKELYDTWRWPYGLWTCPDGREVLFNRQYKPIWQRMPGKSAAAADPGEWVRFAKQAWFHDDHTSPRR